MTVECHP